MSHPLSYFRFCPHCGSNRFIEHDFKAKHCELCGFVYYANVAAATACFIKNGRGELLVARRKKEPAKDTLDLPGGFVDMSENGEEAIVREIKEETNLEITELKYLFSLPNIYRYSGMDIHTLDLFFETTVENCEYMSANDDVSELLFLPLHEVDASFFGLNSVRDAVEKYLCLSLLKEK